MTLSSARLLRPLFLICLLAAAIGAQAQVNALDGVGLSSATPAKPAYSLRKLSSAYTGSAVEVRRSSDNSLQNIGFTPSGALDTAALKAFVGLASGFVSKWYDQGGSAIDAVQASASLQPRIVNSGSIDRMNGKPALYFATSNLATAAVVLFPTAVTLIGVAQGTGSVPGSLATKTGLSTGEAQHFPAPFDFSNASGNFLVGDAANLNTLSTLSLSGSTPRSSVVSEVGASIFGFVITGPGGAMTNLLNGYPVRSTTAATFADRGAPLRIGDRNGGGGAGNFYCPELVFFPNVLSTSSRRAVEGAQQAYYGLPCTALSVTGPATICSGQTVQLVASGADTYSWSPGGATSATLVATPTATTDYTVTGTWNGCSSTKTLRVTVLPTPQLSAGADRTVTPGTAVTLTATTDASTLAWHPVYSTASSVTVLPAETTTYRVNASSANGCTAEDFVTITLATVPAISGSTIVCAGGSTTLTASGTGSIAWYTNQTTGSTLHTGAVFTTPALTASTTYWVSASGGPRVPVRVQVLQTVPVASPAAICAGSGSELSLTNTGAIASWYDAPTGGNLLYRSAGSFPVQLAQTTTYYVQADAQEQTDTIFYTGSVQTFTVPADVVSIQVDLRAGSGGGDNPGGPGGRVQATLSVTPGQQLSLYAGGAGTYSASYSITAGGFNGGGAATTEYSGSGGGASDIRIGGTGLTDRVLVAGGGGGAGHYAGYGQGGAGGGLTGGLSPVVMPGYYASEVNGKPGTQTMYGEGGDGTYPPSAGPGSWGAGGPGQGGGGGGGWFGGGGGSLVGAAGGGGSSYTNPALTQNVVHTQGYHSGNGMIILKYRAACTNTARVPVTVTVQAANPVTITASADTTCGSVQLTASGASSYSWSTPPVIPSAKLAAGLHQLSSSFNGSALQLRRPSDNAVAEFGFINGELNLAAIYAFLGSETGRCVKLFDQSGNGNHLEQTDPLRQPLFVASGINGRPVLRFSASPARFMTSPVVLGEPYTAIYLARQNGPARGRMLSTVYNNWLLGWWSGNKGMAHFDNWVSPAGGIPADAMAYLYAATRSGGTSRVFENGIPLYSSGNGGGGINGLQVNGNAGGPIELSDGDFGDILLFNTALSDDARAEVEGYSARYYGLATPISNATITVTPTGPATTYYVTGASATGCSTTVGKTIVKDGRPPVVQCPAGQELIVNASCAATLPDYRSLLTAADECSPASSLVITQLPAAGSPINGMDTVRVQFTVRDSAGYEASCTINIIPRDTSALRMVCPSGRTVTQEIGACGAYVSLTAPVTTNCRTATVVQTGGPASATLFPVGTSAVTFTASDGAGNTASCSYTVTVLPLLPVLSGDTLVCTGGSTTLTINNIAGSSSVSWYTGPNASGTLVATANPLVNAGAGTYYARYQGPCVPEEKRVTVSEFTDSLTIAGDSILCAGSRSFLTASGFALNGWLDLALPVDAAPSSAKLALGLRLLSSTYTGPLLRLRRASDDAQQDFNAIGRHLDTAAVSAWAGGSAVFCVTLYDQSGNGAHLTQATASAQPQLLLHSAANDLPALRFGTTQFMRLDAQFPAPFTITYTARQTGGVRARVLSTYRNNWLLGWHNGQQGKAFFNNGWVQENGYAANNSIQVYTGRSTGSVSAIYENGLLLAANGGGTNGPDGLQLNGLGNGERSDCEFMEVLAFDTALADSVQTSVEAGAINYYVNRSRLLVSDPAAGTHRIYTAFGARPSCATFSSRSVTVKSPIAGDPALYGAGTWNVYVWNSGGASVHAGTWSANYSGYYTAATLGLNSHAQWASGTSPSGAAGYVGCPVGADNHSWSAKRKGFPCSRYRLSVTAHDDAAELWINGVKVWEHAICCDQHPNVWEGVLSSSDSVEFRVTEGSGGSGGTLVFTEINLPLTVSYAASFACPTTVVPAPVVSTTGGFYTASPAGLLIDGASGVITVPGSTAGSYTITYHIISPCGDTTRGTAPFVIAATGDPALYGNDIWNVYVYNSGGAAVHAGTWSANYSGYYTAATLGLNSHAQWASGTPPSGAAGYIGCPVGADNHSWSAKRKGFPCSRYRLSVTAHDDAAELWINGVKVWEHAICCDQHPDIWEGVLGATDSVEFRVTQGSGGSGGTLAFTDIGYPVTLTYATSSACPNTAVPAPVVSRSGGFFSAAPAGLLIDSSTGIITVPGSAFGNYLITYHWRTPCGDTARATAPFANAPTGDPAQYGNGIWNVYVYNSGGAAVHSGTWSQNYSGYYTAAATSFNTAAHWASGTSPSGAAGYVGCPVGADNHSWSAKRQGFPCGRYRLSVTAHDDAAELWINGVKVWEHAICCDQHPNIWEGFLSSTDSIEFRVTEATAGSVGTLEFTPVTDPVTLSYPVAGGCVGDSTVASVVSTAGGFYTAAPAGLLIDGASGVVTVPGSAAGSYTITYHWPTPCGDTVRATAPFRVAAVAGDPALYGNGIWNVYAYRSGGAAVDANTWNLNYSGFYTASGTGFNTAAQWPAAGAPSDAANYQGCPVGADGHSWAAKRQGFTCGYYRIDITGHDDAAELWINGVKVWEHSAFGDQHHGVWTGHLSVTDSVMFRGSEALGDAYGTIDIVAVSAAVAFNYNASGVCTSYGLLTPSVSRSGGVFSAAPAGLSIDSLTGVINTAASAAGQYTITNTITDECGQVLTTSVTLSVTAVQGDPSVFGAGVWNVYAWNSGSTGSIPNSNVWNLNYTGFFTAAGLNFNTEEHWSNIGNPSEAAGYGGCAVNPYQFSWSAKRTGFPCDRYQVNIPTHRYTGQLWINGVMVWEHRGSGDYHSNVWTGFLGPTDSVEFRCFSNGSGFGSIAFIPLGYSVDLSYPVSNSCSGSAPVAATVNFGGGVFSALPAGLALDTASGTITPTASSTGSYTIYYTWVSPCGDTQVDSAQLSVGAQQGDPSVFGVDQWRVHVWNSGGASIAPNAWSTNYSGYYTAAGTDFSTLNQWADHLPPSDAPGYAGCAVGTENHSWSAKRKGFPCGYYTVNIDSHDDAAQLWINGVKVWEHNSCCDTHSQVWEGMLGATDSVEFRVTQGIGGAQGALSFQLSAPTFSYTSSPYCTSAGVVSPNRQLSGGTFTASPAGLSVNAATGAVNTAASLGGIYTVTYTLVTSCGDTLVGTAPITINAPGGDPSVPGTNAWNVYAWNAGDHANQAQSWNTAYVGYIPGATTSQSPNFSYANGNYPSAHPAFQGCPITSRSFSWSAVRKGFTCGYYALRITTLDVSGELWINGDLIRRFGRFEASSAVVWQGYLSSADTVEMRVRSTSTLGSRLGLSLTAIAEAAGLAYPASTGCYVAGSNETVSPVITGIATGTFSATPSGLALDPATGALDLASSSAGSYTVTSSGTSICGTALSASTALTVVVAAGNPATFGTNQWNVYAWNAGDQSGTPWSAAYAGYYVEPTLDLNTLTRWDPSGTPSSASGYQGCTVGADNHSWSAKRQGFPCGYYTIDVPAHDDKVELRINDSLVFAHSDCCDAHTAVWEGVLGPDDKIEFRVSEGVGGSMGQLTLTLHATITASTWTGAADSDWTNGANWCGPVPLATTDVVIPASAVNQPVVASGAVATARNLIVQSGSSLMVAGTMNLYGNLMNNGGTLDMTQGRLDLEGNTRQQVPAFTVQALHVNGGGGFILSGHSVVSGSLTFGASGGHVILGSSNLTVGSISGGDGSAFVVTNGSGALTRRSLAGTQLMPVGLSTASYTPLSITTAEGLDWTVRLQGDFAGYAAVNQSLALPRIWHITPSVTPTATPASLIFTYPDSLWTTPSLVSVFRYGVTGGWALANNDASGITAVLNGGLRSVSLMGQQAFSPFAIGSTSTPLPVSLLYFSGQSTGRTNQLQWRTASEQDNRGFQVERSYDGRVFARIGFVGSAAPSGTSNTSLDYRFADSLYAGLRQYYRLRQEDINGESRYSHVVTLQQRSVPPAITVYPNPARTSTELRIVGGKEGQVLITLSDPAGRIVWKQTRGIGVGVSVQTISLQGLAAGIYQVQVHTTSGDYLGSVRIVKE
ncbi:arabinofuranosidase catalytic domain-containing protein [Flaviaesturariibacter amylovorans]|uniref:receptor protein-tyrosine kinase n=1 Tax=Flaviaesturariibacter amylovorans TaxID=1084520 RepID=A0ABP8GFD3_9BACT